MKSYIFYFVRTIQVLQFSPNNEYLAVGTPWGNVIILDCIKNLIPVLHFKLIVPITHIDWNYKSDKLRIQDNLNRLTFINIETVTKKKVNCDSESPCQIFVVNDHLNMWHFWKNRLCRPLRGLIIP